MAMVELTHRFRLPRKEFIFAFAVRPNLLSCTIALGCTIVLYFAGLAVGYETSLRLYSLPMLVLLPLTAIYVLLGACLIEIYRKRPERPTQHLKYKLMNDWQLVGRIARGLPIMLIFPVLLSSFTSYKSAIGRVFPFYFDPIAVKIDLWIHGMDPWRLAQMLTFSPAVSFALNWIYTAWFFVMYFILLFVVFFVDNEKLRSQFLTAFVLCWMLIGVVTATALSSAGPCYYLHFFGDDHFAGLLSYLDNVPEQYKIPARDLQKLLLEKYYETELGLGKGISAAPSMHVSIAVLNAILLSRVGRVFAVLGWLYAATIFVGSVHLAWHYAIDGYISLVMTILIWKWSGRLAERFSFQPKPALAAARA